MDEKFLQLIDIERQRQFQKWGEQLHSPERWVVILMEEVGEVAQAILQEDDINYEYELIQVAAVCVAALRSWEKTHPPSDIPH